MVEQAAKQSAVPKLREQRIDRIIASRDRAVDALGREQDAALQLKGRPNGAQRLALEWSSASSF